MKIFLTHGAPCKGTTAFHFGEGYLCVDRVSMLCSGRLGLGVLERPDPNPRLRKYFLGPTLIPFFRDKKVLQVCLQW